MDYLGEVILELPNHKVNVNPWKIKRKDANALSAKITQARINTTAYGKVPPEKDESREKWLERYAEYLAEQRKPKDGELASSYVGRMMEPTAYEDNMSFLKEVLVACCDLVNQGFRITDDVFDELSVLEATTFCQTICKTARIPIPELE